ncbi:MAG TPA: lysophospholipid acyltransferase family protein [Candidatus Deferrimicrobiaceae bacterium]
MSRGSTKTTVFQWIFVAIVTLCLGIPFMVAGFLQPGLTRKGRLFRTLSKTYSRVLFAAFRIRVVTRGIERIDPRQGYVFMANHASIADPLAVAIAIPHPLHFVFKREFARIPVFGWALLSLGQIMVDREDREQAKVALAGLASGLSGNSSVIIFPEGRVSRDGTLQPLKKGGFHLALRTGLPIVPLRIEGARDVCPPGGSGHFHPGTVSVGVFPPIPVGSGTEEEIPALMESVNRFLLSGEEPSRLPL